MTLSEGHVFADDASVMRRALLVASQGVGYVEPNPAVGAVIVDQHRRFVAEGFHQRFGQNHAEVNAIAAAGNSTRGAHLYVTLEPCSHHGKTPPCADAVIAAGFSKVFIGCQDPAEHVAGNGIARLRAAGIDVVVGLCESESEQLIAPFRKLMLQRLPWVHAKWAMTLDGRIASRTGHSKWISNEESRAYVHELRGRMDAIVTGAGTVRADNPMLTARPEGTRHALRVVVDSDGSSVTDGCQLLRTLDQAALLISVAEEHAGNLNLMKLSKLGVEIHAAQGGSRSERAADLLAELGRRKCTNVLVEAGGGLLGSFFDANLVDEVHVFVAPKIVGGLNAMSPVGGEGLEQIPALATLQNVSVRSFSGDTLIQGRVDRSGA
ncbi:MAG: bifunctional diaminohydroxyphosphoribosylaminopyrimidine deaminase/5-amino-6-(5-phosphoribosylamino)uracil reductase RibD [Fuerstiella sp.]